MFDQNLALTGGAPGVLPETSGTMIYQTQMRALNIYNTFYANQNSRGVGQAEAVIFICNCSNYRSCTALLYKKEGGAAVMANETTKVAPATKVKAKKEKPPKKKQTKGMKILTVIFSIISVFYVAPVFIVLMNSFKTNAGISKYPFALPNAETFYGLKSYITGMFFGNFPFWKTILCSLFITVGGVFLILLCTSMCAWYLQRSNSIICKIIYYFCIFSMVVPFQMVMFTLAKTADNLHLTNPVGILVIYLGFGAGLAVFMFSGFVKSIPIEIEEAADVDGAGPLKTFFGIVLPIMKPTFISVGILETMWIWNDYLLPYLILDKSLYKTIPIHIQYLNGSYGHTDTSAIMALIVLSIIPIIIFYFACQKYIIEGVVAGAVKG